MKALWSLSQVHLQFYTPQHRLAWALAALLAWACWTDLAMGEDTVTVEKRRIDDKIENLERMRQQAYKGGGQQRIDQQHGRGKLTARERQL